VGGRLLRVESMGASRLPAGGTLRVVNPDDHGLGAVVVTTSEHPPGEAVPSHKHPCGEIFVVTGGRGRFTVDDEVIIADLGDMVVVPAGCWHGFCPDDDRELRLVCAFDGGAMNTTFPEDSPLAAFNPPSA
jgi:quercetin dioxygenase-like cupin family protein